MEPQDATPSTKKVKFSSTDLRNFGQAIKEAGYNVGQIGWEYDDLGKIGRQAFVEKIDKFIAAITRSWNLMRQDILDDD